MSPSLVLEGVDSVLNIDAAGWEAMVKGRRRDRERRFPSSKDSRVRVRLVEPRPWKAVTAVIVFESIFGGSSKGAQLLVYP